MDPAQKVVTQDDADEANRQNLTKELNSLGIPTSVEDVTPPIEHPIGLEESDWQKDLKNNLGDIKEDTLTGGPKYREAKSKNWLAKKLELLRKKKQPDEEVKWK